MTKAEIEAKRQAVVNALVYSGWKPNVMQKDLIRAYREKKKFIFARVGRKGGKTEGVVKLLCEMALMEDNAAIYYIAPYIKQAKEIIWVNGRLPKALPPEVFTHVDKQELRITLANGSFIKVDGSDNHDNWAGISPHGVVLDEFRSFKPQFYEVMNPNRGPMNAPLIIIGTPPRVIPGVPEEEQSQYLKLWNLAVAEEKKGKAKAIHYPSTVNDSSPHLAEFFEEERLKLESMGMEDIYRQEYLAEFVVSSSISIFPTPKVFDEKRLVKPHQEIIHDLARRSKDLEWGVIADPASSSCFGVIFAAYDKYKSHVYYLDELYEKKQSEMTSDRMWDQIQKKAYDLFPFPDRWNYLYDEAATWWMNELTQRYGTPWIPSQKRQQKKEDGIALLKDMFIGGYCTLSDRCENLKWEILNYHLIARGGQLVPVKADDHLIDPCRYWNTFIGINLNGVEKIETPENVGFHERLYSQGDRVESSGMGEMEGIPYLEDELYGDFDGF